MNTLYLLPSFYAHIINGMLLLFGVIMLFNNYTKIKQLEPYKRIMLTLMFSVCVGIHGLSHFGLETIYRYNPLNI